MAYISTGAFPDGSMVSFDAPRRELIINMARGGIMKTLHLPARPFAAPAAGSFVIPEVPKRPVTMTATVHKLGYKKMPVVGSEIWNQRFLRLEADHLTYHVDETQAARGFITLVSGCKVRVIQAGDRSRKDRHEDRGTSMMSMMMNPMGAVLDEYSEPIGRPNCVELYVPARVGNMIDSVMNSSPIALAMRGGASALHSSAARTFYFSFESQSFREANDFAAALQNNIDIIVKNTPTAPMGGGSTGSGMQGMMNMAQAMQANQALAQKVRFSILLFGKKHPSHVICFAGGHVA
jgi:hypothetical protein